MPTKSTDSKYYRENKRIRGSCFEIEITKEPNSV